MNVFIEKARHKLRDIKKDRLKRACLSVGLMVILIPIWLVTLKLLGAMMIYLIFSCIGLATIYMILSSLLLAVEVVIIMMILYLINIIKDDEVE